MTFKELANLQIGDLLIFNNIFKEYESLVVNIDDDGFLDFCVNPLSNEDSLNYFSFENDMRVLLKHEKVI